MSRIKTSGVYEIVNLANSHRYVGSAVDIYQRWRAHRSNLNRNIHPNIHLQRAWNKYGSDCFNFRVIEHCFTFVLTLREQFWIDKLKPEYNILPRAGNSLGLKHTDDAKAKMSKIQKGKRHSIETREKMSAWQIGLKRPPHTPEARAKMSLSHKGRKAKPETLAKRSTTLKNVWANYTPEQREARVSKLRGKKMSDEQRARLSELAKGRTVSPETRAKISAAGKNRKATPEQKARRSEWKKAWWKKKKESEQKPQ